MRHGWACAALLAVASGCVGNGAPETVNRTALADSLITLFDSLEAIHQAIPDLALLGRMHPPDDTLMFVEGPTVHRFTGDSLVRKVRAAHVGVHSMGPIVTERVSLILDADHALLSGRERVTWSDRRGTHAWDGVLTIVVARSGDRWVIRGYRL